MMQLGLQAARPLSSELSKHQAIQKQIFAKALASYPNTELIGSKAFNTRKEQTKARVKVRNELEKEK